MGTATVARMEVGGMVNDGVEGGKMQGDTMALVPVAKIVATGFPDNWEAAIGTLVAARDRMAGNILRYRYATGMLAMMVAEDRNKSEGESRLGNHTLNDIAFEIAEKKSTVYACMKFFSRTTPKQLELLIEKPWAWRAVAALVTVEDPNARRKLKADYESRKIGNSDRFKEAVREHNEEANLVRSKKRKQEGKKKSSHGGRYTRSKIEGMKTVGNALLSRTIPEFLDGLQENRKERDHYAPVTAENIANLIVEVGGVVDELLRDLKMVRTEIDRLRLTQARTQAESEAQ